MTTPPIITPACLDLSASPIAASYARNHIAGVLPAWGREDLIDPAQLVISELVTNAVKATLDASAPSPDPYDHPKVADWIFIPRPPRIRISVYPSGHGVVLEVWDISRIPPRPIEAGPWDEGGRGLHIVDELATSWGYRWPKSGGKIVYAVLGDA